MKSWSKRSLKEVLLYKCQFTSKFAKEPNFQCGGKNESEFAFTNTRPTYFVF
jgi:hypothetical protein